jgi:hypothetical protein
MRMAISGWATNRAYNLRGETSAACLQAAAHVVCKVISSSAKR